MAINAIKDAVWNGEFPKPGHYFTRRRRIRTSRLELCAPQLKAEMLGQLYQEIPLDPNLLGITPLLLPDNDFRHTHARSFWGFRLGRPPNTPPNEIMFLKPKPPSI